MSVSFSLRPRHGRNGSRKRVEWGPWFPEPSKKELGGLYEQLFLVTLRHGTAAIPLSLPID